MNYFIFLTLNYLGISNKNVEKKYDFTVLEQNLKIKSVNVDEE